MRRQHIRGATRHKIAMACRLLAQGKLKSEVAAALKVTDRAIENWQNDHPDIWNRDYRAAIRELTEAIGKERAAKQEAVKLLTPEEVAADIPVLPDPMPARPNPSEPYALSGVMDLYQSHHPGLTPLHWYQMGITLRQFEKWAGRGLMISDLSDDFVLAFLSAYHARGRSPSTVNSKRTYILALWRFAKKHRLCRRGPHDIPRLKVKLKLPEAWTVEEIGEILTQARAMPGDIGQSIHPRFSTPYGIRASHWWTSLLLVLYDTGARIGAVMQLRPIDVNLEAAAIIFPPDIQKDGRPKLCRLYPETVEACRKIWNADRDVMWPFPFSPEMFTQKARLLLKRAGVKFGQAHGGVFHKFRRTSGSLVEAAGGDGARHLGNSRKIFEAHYKDPRVVDRTAPMLLPRPTMEPS